MKRGPACNTQNAFDPTRLCECEGSFIRAIFCCVFFLLMDVNEWINDECAECVLPRLNIRDCRFAVHIRQKKERQVFQRYLVYVELNYTGHVSSHPNVLVISYNPDISGFRI